MCSGKVIGYLGFSRQGVFIGDGAMSGVDPGPLTYSSSDLWKLSEKIRLQELVSSNSENISCVSLLKHKNSRKQGTGTVATC